MMASWPLAPNEENLPVEKDSGSLQKICIKSNIPSAHSKVIWKQGPCSTGPIKGSGGIFACAT